MIYDRPLMPACLTAEVVEDYIDRRLDAESSAAVAQHISGCATCSELASALASDRQLVDELREHLGPGAARAPALRPPVIPGYEIHHEIHRGGQGVVYAATQASTGRGAAVKVLLSGPHATRQERERFEREVSLAASLRHPGIVTVFDGGATAEGWNWLAMELVEGAPLNRSLSERRPAIREALALFREICDAVQHAHLKGVIHRDLKPGNVLVDAAGHARVLDFGLAKEIVPTDDPSAGNTASGEFVGTLQWAAPEQLSGDSHKIDVRTDVHALGLLLFRLLTGEHPWRMDLGLADLMRTIAEIDPPPPSSLAAGVDRDLDAIVLKALAKEPDRRYPSAGELLRDLDRHLRGEPVEARGRDRWYVFRKAVRRHRVLVIAGTVVFLGLAAATIVSLVFRREAEQSLADARKSAAAATAEAEKSAEIVALMKKALESSRSLRKGKAMTMVDFLDDVAAELDANLPRNPRGEAVLRTSLGITYSHLGLPQKGVDQLRKGVLLHEKAGGPDDRDRLSAAIALGVTLEVLGPANRAEAEAIFDDVIKRAGKAPDSSDAIMFRARLERALAWASTGRAEEALAEAERLVGELEPLGQRAHAMLLRATHVILVCLDGLGRFADADRVIDDALERSLEDADRLPLLLFRAQNSRRQGRLPESIETAAAGLSLAKKTYPDDQPVSVQLRLSLAESHYGAVHFAEAEPLFREVLEINARAPTLNPGDVQRVKARLGSILLQRNALAEAEPLLREAVALSDRTGGPDSMGSRDSRTSLAWLLVLSDRPREAEPLLRDLVRALPSNLRGNSEAVLALDLLARVCAATDRLTEAESLYAPIANVRFPRIPGLSRADVLRRYAEVLERLGKAEEAVNVRRMAETRSAPPR
jgi:tetratricopeptide (TPR) repeat protein